MNRAARRAAARDLSRAERALSRTLAHIRALGGVTVEHRDHVYLIAPSPETISGLDPSKPIATLRAVLGDDQYAAFKASGARADDAAVLLDKITAALP